MFRIFWDAPIVEAVSMPDVFDRSGWIPYILASGPKSMTLISAKCFRECLCDAVRQRIVRFQTDRESRRGSAQVLDDHGDYVRRSVRRKRNNMWLESESFAHLKDRAQRRK